MTGTEECWPGQEVLVSEQSHQNGVDIARDAASGVGGVWAHFRGARQVIGDRMSAQATMADSKETRVAARASGTS